MKKILYTPLTATPFKQTEKYRERLPQTPDLARYIRCFWGSEMPYVANESSPSTTVIVPDTCADIIYHIDYTADTITGRFCGINDTSYEAYEDTQASQRGHLVSIFAIRFYAWSVCIFSEDSLKGTVNGSYDVRSRFTWLDKELRERLFEKHSLEERSQIAEGLLLRRPFPARQHPAVDHAVKTILLQKGVLRTAQLAEECCISGRQLERLFHGYIGITPKKLCNLVRYQCLWNEILRDPKFCILDAVCRYGYTDQSHLMHAFKRYHTMGIQKALLYARHNVGNIQYFHDRPC